jgi:hypothetical protein
LSAKTYQKAEKNKGDWAELIMRVESHRRHLETEVEKMDPTKMRNEGNLRERYPRDKHLDDTLIEYIK